MKRRGRGSDVRRFANGDGGGGVGHLELGPLRPGGLLGCALHIQSFGDVVGRRALARDCPRGRPARIELVILNFVVLDLIIHQVADGFKEGGPFRARATVLRCDILISIRPRESSVVGMKQKAEGSIPFRVNDPFIRLAAFPHHGIIVERLEEGDASERARSGKANQRVHRVRPG